MKNSIFALMLAGSIASCTNSATIQPARSAEIETSGIITPLKIVDFETDLTKKIEGTASGYLSNKLNLDYYKELSIANACATANVDFLINPTYTITTKGNIVTVQVKGYPAKYSGIRTAVAADSIHFKYSKENPQGAQRSKGQFKLIY
jgi:hypothetical protein